MTGSFIPTCLEQIFPEQPKPLAVGFGRVYLTFPDPVEGTSAVLSTFPKGGYKRKRVVGGIVEYLPSGNSAVKGSCSEPLYQWDLKAVVTEQDLRLFETLVYRQDYKRRTDRDAFHVFLDDLIMPITESSVSSFRSEVTGSEASTVSFAQTVNYYARFKTYIPLEEIGDYEKTGQGWTISFKAYEL